MSYELNSTEKKSDIRERTYTFSLRIINLCKALNEDRIGRVLFNQLLRSGTSIGANVEEAQGGQSKKDFLAKFFIARKEARETHYWLRLLRDSGTLPKEKMSEIIDECEQITRILTSIILSTQENS